MESKRREGRIIHKHGIPVLVFDDPQPANYDIVEEIRKDREARARYVAGEGGYDREDFGYGSSG